MLAVTAKLHRLGSPAPLWPLAGWCSRLTCPGGWREKTAISYHAEWPPLATGRLSVLSPGQKHTFPRLKFLANVNTQ
jgi:hypothetical protein